MALASRKTITLSDGTAVEIRKLRRMDVLEISDGIDLASFQAARSRGEPVSADHARLFQDFIFRAIARAVVSPRIETEGLPGPLNGHLHILDLEDDDVDLITSALMGFAFGGTRRETFPAPPPDAAAGGDRRDSAAVREAPERNPGPES